MSPAIRWLNGSSVLHSGCYGARAFTRSIANRNWKYIGCSAQRVPSLSNVAMRERLVCVFVDHYSVNVIPTRTPRLSGGYVFLFPTM
jgi:hypothetical protein